MYYISIQGDDSNKLVYYCRNCGHIDDDTRKSILKSKNIFITQTNLKKKEQEFSHIINKYTKLDPTLPRINTILCPNGDCATNTKDKEREIIYIRYDDMNMKYVYLCSECETVWKTNEQT
jgi:hypothetical protein